VPSPGANDAQAGFVGRGLHQLVAEEGTQRGRVGAAAGDGTLAAEVSEGGDHEHLEIDRGIDVGAPAARGVRIGQTAEFADACGEADGFQRFVELAVEGAGRCLRQAAGHDPEFLLAFGLRFPNMLGRGIGGSAAVFNRLLGGFEALAFLGLATSSPGFHSSIKLGML